MKNAFRRFLPAVLSLTLGATVPTGCADGCGERTLNVLSYNIRNGIGMDGRMDYGRIAEAVCRSGADLVAVQEADSATRRSGGRYLLGELAAETGLHAEFGAAIPYEDGGYGIGILSREKPLDVRRIPLPGREEARMLLVAEFDDFVFACVHLSLVEEDRLASVETIRAEAIRCGKPFVLAGDWNDSPCSALLETMDAAGFAIVSDRSVHTFPADAPRETIDYVAVFDPGTMRPADACVLEEPVASDHRPVRVSLRFGK